MPELPEVQTVVNSLQGLKNKKITNFKLYHNNVLYNKENKLLLKNTIFNKKICSVYRIGKYIIIKLDKMYLSFHLRMTGYLYLSKTNKKNKYIRCYFTINNNEYLCFEDIRKFGGFYYHESINFIKNKIGIDPFNINFTTNWVIKNLTKKNCQMKNLLLDQGFICGLGNIYIDEVLWKSKIHPLKKSSTLSKLNCENLHNNIIETLNNSINHHGTTIINFKFDNMKSGTYKNKLNVYGRKNQNCKRCNNKIIKIKVAGRGTYICQKCQKLN